MDMSLSGLMQLVRFTLQDPRGAARALKAANVPMSARWTALLLMAVLSAVFTQLSISLMPVEDQAMMGGMAFSPLRVAVLQGVVMLVLVQAVHFIGRWRGGHGTFGDALLLITWLQFVLLALQVVQIGLQLVAPPVADIVGLLALVLFLWLLTNFIAELHGFRSLGLVFLGILGSLAGITLLLFVLILVLLMPGA